jgi:hypothetical protein
MPACEGPQLLPPPRSSTPALSSRDSSTRLLLERRSSPSIDSSPLHAHRRHGILPKLCNMRARVFKSKRRLHGYTSQHILDETLLTDKHIAETPPPLILSCGWTSSGGKDILPLGSPAPRHLIEQQPCLPVHTYTLVAPVHVVEDLHDSGGGHDAGWPCLATGGSHGCGAKLSHRPHSRYHLQF